MKDNNTKQAEGRGAGEMILDGFLVLGFVFFAVRFTMWAAVGFPFVK